MSASGLPDELTGAFLEIAEVTDLGEAEEEETIVGNTTTDVSIEYDQERAEGNKHSQRRQLSRPTYNSVTIEVPWLLTPGAEQMETFGIVDENGEEIIGDTWEACRIHVYDTDDFSEDPGQSFEFEQVEWEIEDFELGEDFGEITMQGFVHGTWRRGTTEA